MRILHVGSGFRPWRRGGLVAYAEDLMFGQVRRGHEVTYFLSGRQYPFLRRPRLKRWDHWAVAMREVVNSPLLDHGRQPSLEISEPQVERMFDRVLAEVCPQVIHVQELAGLPSAILDVSARNGIPCVFTLQDYFPLCPMFRLFDSQERVCLRTQVGEDCVATAAADPRPPEMMLEGTIMYHLYWARPFRWVPAERRIRVLNPYVRALARGALATRRHRPEDSRTLAAAYQRRRETNVGRLNRVDKLIAMSERVAEIYHLLGVDPERISTLQLSLAHIERFRLRGRSPRGRLTLATLAGLESRWKGGRLLIDAVRRLHAGPASGRFRLLVFGGVAAELQSEAVALPELELHGYYPTDRLDVLLEEVDVGIMPSVWEEPYGYAGVEFLAKGIPLIANAIGGMSEYTQEGRTGWLNRSCSARGLAHIVQELVQRPDEVERVTRSTRASRESLVKPFERHLDEMDEIYAQIIAARAGRRRAPTAD